jgi:DMSO/TMAO reductase YedYZ heme-binding membrane subunit
MTARTRADLAGLAAAASLLIVVALWWHGLTEFDWPAVGRLTGLLSADLLLLQVFTLARIPFVERAFGQDRLARWHRWSGFTSFNLLLVHIVTITIGYAVPVHASVLGEAWDLVVAYPGMLLAVAGAALLTMVVVTSLRAARRRLRFESWHLLHLYAYLGIGLAAGSVTWCLASHGIGSTSAARTTGAPTCVPLFCTRAYPPTVSITRASPGRRNDATNHALAAVHCGGSGVVVQLQDQHDGRRRRYGHRHAGHRAG